MSVGGKLRQDPPVLHMHALSLQALHLPRYKSFAKLGLDEHRGPCEALKEVSQSRGTLFKSIAVNVQACQPSCRALL